MSRDIGPLGAVARAGVGVALLAPGLLDGPNWWDAAAAAAAYPLLASMTAAALTRLTRLRLVQSSVTGRWSAAEAGASLAVGVIVLLMGTALTFLSPVDAPSLLLFFGGSMLLAALLGYAGCEVLALPNLLLGRRDALWCLLFSPVDSREADSAVAAGQSEL